MSVIIFWPYLQQVLTLNVRTPLSHISRRKAAVTTVEGSILFLRSHLCFSSWTLVERHHMNDELSETLQRRWHIWPKHGCLRGRVLGELGWGISALQSTTPPPTLQFNLGRWLQSSEAGPPIFMSLTGIEPTTFSVGVAYYFCTMLDHWNTVAINILGPRPLC